MTTEDSKFEYVVLPGSPLLRTLTLEEQIYWFEDSLQRWVFRPAQLLLDTGNKDDDYAVLAILNAVPEMLAKCQGYVELYNEESFNDEKPTGDEKPTCDKKPTLAVYLYRKGLEYIFPDRDHNVFDDKELLDELIYGKLRCGLAHFAFADEKICLLRDCENLGSIGIDRAVPSHKPAWVYRPPNPLLSVNVPEWYKQTKKRVNDYLNELRDDSNKDLRKNFQKQIILGRGQRKGTSPTICVCGPKQFCFRCASEKFPIKSLGESKSS